MVQTKGSFLSSSSGRKTALIKCIYSSLNQNILNLMLSWKMTFLLRICTKTTLFFVNLQIGVKMTYLLHIIKYALDEMLEGIFVLV